MQSSTSAAGVMMSPLVLKSDLLQAQHGIVTEERLTGLHITDNQKKMLMKAQVPNIENPGQFLDALYRKKENTTPKAKQICTL